MFYYFNNIRLCISILIGLRVTIIMSYIIRFSYIIHWNNISILNLYFNFYLVISIIVINISSFSKLKFIAIDFAEKHYSQWILDVEMHLEASTFNETIKDGNKVSPQDRTKALIFLCRHLNEGLKCEYMNVKIPHIVTPRTRSSSRSVILKIIYIQCNFKKIFQNTLQYKIL